MSITVPEGLSDLLQDFAIVVLREKPTDLVAFAAKYFTELHEKKFSEKEADKADEEAPTDAAVTETGEKMMNIVITGDSVEMKEDEDSDIDDEPPPPMYRSGMNSRRKSVFAEAYDPEEQEDTEKIVHPKSDDQRASLTTAMTKIFLFKALDREQLAEVLDAMFDRQVSPGEHVIDQGDDGDNFYVIEKGTFDIYVDSKQVGKYDNEGFFGELALMYNAPRAATIVATSEGVLWALDQKTFKRIVCSAACRKRETYAALLESVPLFESLMHYERMSLADAIERKYYSDGDCIIKQGDQAEHFFLVEEGKVTISREDPSKPGESVHLSDCIKGQYFGELALLTKRTRAASVHAVGDVTCAVIDVNAFERLLGPCMSVMKNRIGNYEEQLQKLFGTSLDLTDLRQ